jgi:sister-chromatid-cohesion protein PDS5
LDFIKLSFIVVDSVFEVRREFLKKVAQYLESFSVHSRYLSLLLLVGEEKDQTLFLEIKKIIIRIFSKLRSQESVMYVPEQALSRLIHIIVNQEKNLIIDPKSMERCIKYLDFYLDLILNSENASLLFYISLKLKTVKDTLCESNV